MRRWRAANRQLLLELRAGSLHSVKMETLLGIYEFQVLLAQSSEVARGARFWLLELSARLIEQRAMPIGLPLEQALLDYALLIDSYEASWQWRIGAYLRSAGIGFIGPEEVALEACRKRFNLYVGLASREAQTD